MFELNADLEKARFSLINFCMHMTVTLTHDVLHGTILSLLKVEHDIIQ